VGRRIQIDRVVFRVALLYTAIVAVVLLALGVAAWVYMARVNADALRPIITLSAGAAVYHRVLVRSAVSIGIAEVALIAIVGVAAYALALVSTRPLREAREREQRFAAEAAHELRTPLARIATVAQAAAGGDDDQRRHALETITRTALEASALIGDLLTLARVEHVPSAILEPVDAAMLVRDVASAFAGRRAEIEVGVETIPGAFVQGDASRLQRLVSNVLDNAVRHARSRVAVVVDRRGDRVQVAIADDGAGVPAEMREKIFERFVTTAHSTGLGLPIGRWIARAHGGDLRLVDAARFVIDLPALAGGTERPANLAPESD
jgi:signal transduction histidine kinase